MVKSFQSQQQIHRSSHRRCSIKTGVLKNFAKFTRQHLCQSLTVFLKKVFCKFIKKETLTHVFSCEFCEIFQNTFFTENIWTTASELTRTKSKERYFIVFIVQFEQVFAH